MIGKCLKKKRLREGGVGPEMRSPAGLRVQDTTSGPSLVNYGLPAQAVPA
jgi:hypothetical protein